jgi:hypothetical protein
MVRMNLELLKLQSAFPFSLQSSAAVEPREVFHDVQ